MKKYLAVLLSLFLVSALTGCCLSHQWTEADCETPKTCTKCQETEGEALGHTWTEADCVTPKTCTVCAKTEGQPLDHSWQEATCQAPKSCSACGATEGDTLEHTPGQWELLEGKDCMGAACTVCGDMVEMDYDTEIYAAQHIVGKWIPYNYLLVYTELEIKGRNELYFHEDGTVTGYLDDKDISADGRVTWALNTERSTLGKFGGSFFYDWLVDGVKTYTMTSVLGNEDFEGNPAMGLSLEGNYWYLISKREG